MKTKTYSVYQFSELSDTAKQRAKDKIATILGFTWSNEYRESLAALARRFDGELTDYSFDWFNGSYSDATFAMPDMAPEEIEDRLVKLGTFDPVTLRGCGDCALTGFCADESAIDGFRIAYDGGERRLEALMQSAFKQWFKDGQADCEDQYTDESMTGFCEANGYEFTEDGEVD